MALAQSAPTVSDPALSATGASAATTVAPPARCPDATAQLEDLLAGATRAIGEDGEVRARFEVDRDGHVRSITVGGHRRYSLRTRLALASLSCQGGLPQGYRLTIRFAPDAPGRAASAGLVATLEPQR